jgi:hypothetical protein
MTTVGVRFKDEQQSEKMLPCLTACPMNAFKIQGFHFTNETFYSQTYNMDEIFYENEIFNLTHNSNLTIEEVRGIFTGRCYMVCPKRKTLKKDVLFIHFWKFRAIKGCNSCF